MLRTRLSAIKRDHSFWFHFKMDSGREMEDYEDLLFALLLRRKTKQQQTKLSKRRKRRFWVRNKGATWHIPHLIKELLQDRELFSRYHRMTPDRFEHLLLLLVKDDITKKEMRFRKPITARERERLSLTVRLRVTTLRVFISTFV